MNSQTLLPAAVAATLLASAGAAALALFLDVGGMPTGTGPRMADQTEKNTNLALACAGAPELPSGKEELTTFDVRTAIEQHLARAGIEGASIELTVTDDHTYHVHIADAGQAPVEMEVDPASARVVAISGFEDPTGGFATASGDDASPPDQENDYRQQLRRHMLGDGSGWANWVGMFDKQPDCGGDYSAGGPNIPAVQSGVK